MRFALDDQIAAQPEVVARIVSREMPCLAASRPVVFTGIGTSLHAGTCGTAWTWLVSGSRVRGTAVGAYHLALCYPLTADDQVVAISHRGYERCPHAALAKARAAGAAAIAIVGADALGRDAGAAVRTCPDETSGTFTVSYLSSLAALAGMVASVSGPQSERFAAALRAVP